MTQPGKGLLGVYVSCPLKAHLLKEQLSPFYTLRFYGTQTSLQDAHAQGHLSTLLMQTEDGMRPHLVFKGCAFEKKLALPVSLEELLQHTAVLMAQEVYPLGPWLFFPEKRLLQDKSTPTHALHLREKETALLLFLLHAPQKKASRQKLLEHIWGFSPDMETRTLESHVYQLRQKIEDTPACPRLLLNTEEGYQLGGG
jgi:DNA-binding winged helix-turn-helix (wHTH) protein